MGWDATRTRSSQVSIILPGSRISGTQPLQPRPSFWKSMHLNVLVWHEIGACLSVCASRKKTERFNRTSNGAYSRMYNQFFFLSTVVEPDDYQGSQPVSLWYADIVTLIPMSRREPGGAINVCVRKCVSWGVHWGTIYSMSRGGSQLGLTNNQWGRSQLFCTNPKSLLMSLTWLHLI